MTARRETPKWVTALLAGAVVAGLVSALHAVGLLMPLEYKSRDLRMRWTLPKAGGHSDIVMVCYSEDSLSEIREKWNVDWRDRELFGILFRGLSGQPSSKKPAEGPGAAPPTAVLFDFFTLCDPSELPDNLMSEVECHPSLHLAVPFSVHERKRSYAPDPFLEKFAIPVENDGSVTPPDYKSVLLPVEDISSRLHSVGDVHSHPDVDGVDRRYHLLCTFRGRCYPTFALAAILEREKTRTVRISGGILSVGSFSVPVDKEGAILLRYYRPATTFKAVGVYEILNGRRIYDKNGTAQLYDPRSFEKKIVIVGATAAGLFDLRVTPVAEVNPGMEIHAVAIANLLNGDYLRPVDRKWSYRAIILLALLTALMTRYAHALVGLGAGILLFGAYGGLSLLLFRQRWIIDAAPQLAAVLLSYAGTSTLNFLYEGLQKQRVKRILAQNVSAQVAEKILKNFEGMEFAGERKLLSIFFMDFAGFTTLSEKLDPEELVKLINQYHDTAAHEIFRTEGTLDKFIGDAIMAFWGDPVEQPDHQIRACRSAIALQERLKALADQLQHLGLPGVRARVGINTGVVVVGNVGSKERHNYTAMGNDVNLASRLEGVNKEFGTDIIISDSTYAGAREIVEVRELAFIKVKGKHQAVRIFELLGEKGKVDADRLACARKFEEGLKLFRERKWAEARAVFEAGVKEKAAEVYIDLCARYAEAPPPADWDGSYVMEHK